MQADEGVTALYAAPGVSLIRMAFVILGDRSAAEDVVQDAFVGLYRNWDRLDDPANALPYVRSSVLNGCRAALRARARRDRRDRAAAARDGWPTGTNDRTLRSGLALTWCALLGHLGGEKGGPFHSDLADTFYLVQMAVQEFTIFNCKVAVREGFGNMFSHHAGRQEIEQLTPDGIERPRSFVRLVTVGAPA